MILPTILEQGLAPDVIDDTDPNDVYLGYFRYNSATTPLHCLVKRVTKETIATKEITRIRYPKGRFDFVHDWDERYNETDWRYRDFPSA